MQLENDEQYSNDWKLTTASLDSITALPDHGADGARGHVYMKLDLVVSIGFGSYTLNQTREERLASEIGIYNDVRAN